MITETDPHDSRLLRPFCSMGNLFTFDVDLDCAIDYNVSSHVRYGGFIDTGVQPMGLVK